MAHGIEIRNPSGIISIDGNFRNYQVISSFTISTPNTWIEIPAYRPLPLIFMRPFSYGTTISWDPTFNYLSDDPMATGGMNGYDSYRLPTGNYVLARPITSGTSGETHGIRVWDGSSNVVFDSGKQIVNIDVVVMKTYTPPHPNAANWTQVVYLPNYPSGLRYFLFNTLQILENVYAYTYQDSEGSPGIDYYWMLRLAGVFDNENQITYKIYGYEAVTANTAFGMGLDNTSIPLVSAYITL